MANEINQEKVAMFAPGFIKASIIFHEAEKDYLKNILEAINKKILLDKDVQEMKNEMTDRITKLIDNTDNVIRKLKLNLDEIKK